MIGTREFRPVTANVEIDYVSPITIHADRLKVFAQSHVGIEAHLNDRPVPNTYDCEWKVDGIAEPHPCNGWSYTAPLVQTGQDKTGCGFRRRKSLIPI
jgi:hypothetical protein